jgi:hypothetical protein
MCRCGQAGLAAIVAAGALAACTLDAVDTGAGSQTSGDGQAVDLGAIDSGLQGDDGTDGAGDELPTSPDSEGGEGLIAPDAPETAPDIAPDTPDTADADTVQPPTCDATACSDGNPCTNDYCDDATQACKHNPNALPCDDGNACTVNDACLGGVCGSKTPKPCDDGNVCTQDGCDKVKGCTFAPGPDGSPCVAAGGCEAGGACKAGQCAPTGKAAVGVTTPLAYDDNLVAVTAMSDGGWLAAGANKMGQPILLRRTGGGVSGGKIAGADGVALVGAVGLNGGEAAVIGNKAQSTAWWGRIGNNGKLVQAQTLEPATFSASSMARQPDSGFAIAGQVSSPAAAQGPRVVWLDSAGKATGATTLQLGGAASGTFASVAADGSGRTVAAGSVALTAWAAGFNGATTVWQRSYPGWSKLTSVVPAPGGGWYAVGESKQSGQPGPATQSTSIVRLSADGQSVWAMTTQGAVVVAMLARGTQVIACGRTAGNNAQPWLAALDLGGDTHWSHLYSVWPFTGSCVGVASQPSGPLVAVWNTNGDPYDAVADLDPWGNLTCAQSGACYSKPLTACDDGLPCTRDLCSAPKGCSHPPADGLGCDDGNACTIGELCSASGCGSATKVPLDVKVGSAGADEWLAATRAPNGRQALAGHEGNDAWLRVQGPAGTAINDHFPVKGQGTATARAVAFLGTHWLVAGTTADSFGKVTAWHALIDDKTSAVALTHHAPTVSALSAALHAPTWTAAAGSREDGGDRQGWLLVLANQASVPSSLYFGQPDADEVFLATAAHPDGTLIAAGERKKQGKTDPWLVRLDATGKKLWEYTQGTLAEDPVRAVALLPDGSVVAAGPAHVDGQGDGYLLKLDAAGKQLWRHPVAVGSSGGTIAALETVKDGFLLAGSTLGQNGNGWIGHANHAGGVLDSAVHGGSGQDALHAIVRLPGGRFQAAGASSTNSKGGLDGWVLDVTELGLQPVCDPADKCNGIGAWESDDGNDCTVAACKAGKVTQNATFAICDYGTVCTEGDVCQGQVCKGGAQTNCDDGNVCTLDLCDAVTGKCSNVVQPDGASCGSTAVPCVALTCKKGVCGSAVGEKGLWVKSSFGDEPAAIAALPDGSALILADQGAWESFPGQYSGGRVYRVGPSQEITPTPPMPSQQSAWTRDLVALPGGGWAVVGQSSVGGPLDSAAMLWVAAKFDAVAKLVETSKSGVADDTWATVSHSDAIGLVVGGTLGKAGVLARFDEAGQKLVPDFVDPHPGAIEAVAASGATVYSIRSPMTVRRHDVTLKPLWESQVVPGLAAGASLHSIVPIADGGALTAGKMGASILFVRYGAAGGVRWSRAVPATTASWPWPQLAVASTGQVVWVATFGKLSTRVGAMDLEGNEQWARDFAPVNPPQPYMNWQGLDISVAPDGVVWALVRQPEKDGPYTHVLRLSPFGHASCAEAGSCAQKPLIACDDNNPCTADDCTAKSGCTKSPQPDGASCEDSLPCTLQDVCKSGTCTKGVQASMGVGVLASPQSEKVAQMVPDGADGFLLAGSVDTAMAAMHLDSSGKPIGGVTVPVENGSATAAAVVVAGGLWVLAGHATDKAGKTTWRLEAFKTSGEPAWTAQDTDVGVTSSAILGAVPTTDGLAVAAQRNTGKHDPFVAKWSVAGKQMWQTTVGSATGDEWLDAVGVLPSDAFVTAGAKDAGAAGREGWLVQVDAAGKVLGEAVVAGGPGQDHFFAVSALADGSLIALGERDAPNDAKPWLVRLDAGLKVLWQHTLPAAKDARLDTLLALPPHGFALAGRKDKTTGWIVRTDAFGNVLWAWSGTAGKGLVVSGLVPMATGGLVVAGTALSEPGKDGGDVWFGRIGAWGQTDCTAAGTCAQVAAGALEVGGKCQIEACDLKAGVTSKAAPVGAVCAPGKSCQGQPPQCQ